MHATTFLNPQEIFAESFAVGAIQAVQYVFFSEEFIAGEGSLARCMRTERFGELGPQVCRVLTADGACLLSISGR